jgi:[ribosomal protein S5]-alanine N-acetyltransferase
LEEVTPQVSCGVFIYFVQKREDDHMKLLGDRIYVRFLEIDDAKEMYDLQIRNREFFQAFAKQRDEEFYTIDRQLANIKKSIEKRTLDQQYSFGIFLKGTDELIGTIELTEVLRGALQSCFVGYFLDKKQNGKGYMTEAVRLVMDYALNELKLHRIEAGVMPHNISSIRVLEKDGFQKEGIARKNVRINGKWEDHQVLAYVNEND